MAKKLFYPVCLLFVVLSVLSSCSKRMYPSGGSEAIFYPSPPDTARIQFLARYGNSADFTGKQKKFTTFVAGEKDAAPIVKPYGFAIHNNKMFIADAGVAGLEIFELGKKNSFEYFIPEGRGKLILPINCFVDTEGDLYISDVYRKQVVIFSENLEYKGEIGGEENFKPADVVVSGDTILVTDPNNNRINVYDKMTRELLFVIPEQAEIGDENWLYNPLNLFITGGKIYVTDFGDSKIKTFSMKGEYISSVGSYGKGIGQFIRPKGIAVDNEHNLYVVDAGFENVQIFNKEGQLLMFFGGSYKSHGDMYLPANVVIDYDHLNFFEKYVDPAYQLKYLIFIINQYGPDKLSVYGRIESK